MINPPSERLKPTVCLIMPKGRDRAGHTARDRESEGVREWGSEGGRGEKLLFSSLLLSGCHQSTRHDSSSWLPALVPHLSPLLPSYFHFLLVMRKCPLSLSISLFFLPLWPLFPWTWPQNLQLGIATAIPSFIFCLSPPVLLSSLQFFSSSNP